MMKKFLSILLAFCLMLTVMAVAFPVFAADTYTITFVDAAGGSTTQQYAAGDAIVYPPLTSSRDGDNVWSAGKTTYVEVPETATGDITVYEYLREGFYGFENYYQETSGNNTSKCERLTVANGVMTFDNSVAVNTNYSGVSGTDRYNAIVLGSLTPDLEATYKITVSYKLEASDTAIKLTPYTGNRGSLAWATDRKPYSTKTLETVSVNDTEYKTVSMEITVPKLTDSSDSKQNDAYSNDLYLWVGTNTASATAKMYIDYVKVEKLHTVTYVDATGASAGTETKYEGDALKELAADRLGENYGVWSSSSTELIPVTTMPNADITVYEVVKTGVFDFNNYYRYEDITVSGVSSYGVQDTQTKLLMSAVDGDLVYDTSKTTMNTSSDRRSLIAIGKAEAATKYKITVEYSYNHATNSLKVQPLTGYSAMTYHCTGGAAAIKTAASAVTLEKGDNKTAVIYATTADTFYTNDKSLGGTNQIPDGQVADCFYLKILTTTNGSSSAATTDQLTAEIHKITVEEYKGSITYNIPEGATVNGVTNDTVEVNYYGDGAITFPTVSYADGYTFNAWIDTESFVAVETPVINGNYTLVVNEPVEMVTVTLDRGGEIKTEQVEKGSEYTLPDTEFTDTSWWSRSTANDADYCVGYEDEKVVVNGDVTYYTTETYAADAASIYRNWTGIDTTTEAFSYLYKKVTDEESTTWAHSSGTRLSTRLGVVEDGNTYRISVTYKATTNVDLDFVMVITSDGNAGGTMRNYLENTKKFHTISENTDGWETVTYYITADAPAEVTANTNNNGLDDTKDNTGFESLYLMVNKAKGNDNVEIAIKETKIEDLGNVVEAKGASVLKDEKVVDGEQAIRYYFDYKTAGDGTTITIGGNEYDVVERGFLYTNGAITHYAAAGCIGSAAPESDPDRYDLTGHYFVTAWGSTDYGYGTSFQMWLAKAKTASGKDLLTYKGVSGDALANNWALDEATDTVTFSTYVTDISTANYEAKMMVRGYVIFADENGVEHIVYSETINRSVQGIIDALAERHEK